MKGQHFLARRATPALLLAGAALATGCASGGMREAPRSAPVEGTPVTNTAVERTALAASLAAEARATNSPIGLLAAAQLLIESGASKLELSPESSGATAGAAAPGGAITAEQLIAAAESMGRDNPNVVALAGQLRQRAAAGARGAVGGARVGMYTLPGGATHTFVIPFKAHEPAAVRVTGSEQLELECTVVSSTDREVARDRRGLSRCEMTWFPLEEGTFRIRVKNLNPTGEGTYTFTTN